VAIGVAQAAILARQTRAAMVEVLQQDYVRTARAKGLRERTIIVRHGFRNALIPVVTVLGLQVSNVIGGAIIIESVFSLPGVGKLLIDSIFNRELVTVQALALMIAVSVALSNLLVDVSYAYLDPRIRYD
jgi:peptide/nickel transport system permease protein